MKLNFRQGLVSFQRDITSTPIHIQKNSDSSFLDVNVSPEPTVGTIAHGSSNYLFSENKSISKAWGPFTNTSLTYYFYWDINMITGEITRGSTTLMPITAIGAPSAPDTDQHWFDQTNKKMKVWSGTKWVEKLRLFAGYYTHASTLTLYGMGSQVMLNGEFDAGYIARELDGRPIRLSTGEYLTTSSDMKLGYSPTSSAIRIHDDYVQVVANEIIPKYRLVSLVGANEISLASSNSITPKKPLGLVTQDLVPGDVTNIIFNGVVTNTAWSWPTSSIGSNVYCGPTGEVTVTRPIDPFAYKVGVVININSILLDIDTETELPDLALLGGLTAVDALPPLVDQMVGSAVVLSIPPASTTVDGYMSAADKVAIDNLTTGLVAETQNRILADAEKADIDHIHVVSDVTGLNGLLDDKASIVHAHVINDVTNLQSSLDGKAPIVHTHTTAQVAGLDSVLANKSDVTHTHSLDGLSDVVATIPNVNDVLTFDGVNWGPAASTGSGTGESIIFDVYQPSHGLSKGNAIYGVLTPNLTFQRAIASSEDTLALCLVYEVVDSDNFKAIQAGKIDGLVGLIAGQYYFVSETIPGVLTTTEPTFSNPVLYALSSTSGLVLNYRPSLSGGTGPGGGGTPGGIDKQLQFNDNGVFGGAEGLTFDFGSRTYSLVPSQGTITGECIVGAADNSVGAGGNLRLTSGTASANNASGGTITIQPGGSQGNSIGATLNIHAGQGGSSGPGGTVNIYSGQGGSGQNAGSVRILTNNLERIAVDYRGVVFFNSSAGASGQVLTSSGPTNPPTWQTPSTVPSLTSTQIGFGNVTNELSGDVDLTWDNTTNKLSVGSLADPGVITTVNNANITLKAGNSVTASPGDVYLVGGDNTNATNPASGGNVRIIAGYTLEGVGGSVFINATDGTGASKDGGIVSIQAGQPTPGGAGGHIVFSGEATERFRISSKGAWSLGNTGNNFGAVGNVLTSAGTNTPPQWQNISSIMPSGIVTETTTHTISGSWTFTTLPETSVVPTGSTQFVNKAYVDGVAAGLSFKQSVAVSTITNLVATYNNGTVGLGATLTNNDVQTGLVIDSITMVVGDRVLVKDQTNGIENGIYVVTDVGSGSTNWVMTRSTDADNSPSNEISGGMFVFVDGGTNADTGWVLSSPHGAIVLGTDVIAFTQYSAAGTVTPGGTSTQIQYNTAGTFDASADFTWDNSTKILSVGGRVDGNVVTEKQNSAVISSGTINFDLALGTVFIVSLSSNITSVTFSNVPPAGKTILVTLVLIQDATGGRTVTWPTSFDWPAGVIPALSSTALSKDVVTLITYDAGTTWIAMLSGKDFK